MTKKVALYDIVTYAGKTVKSAGLVNGEQYRVPMIEEDRVWIENINMPFSGFFTGFVNKTDIKEFQ